MSENYQIDNVDREILTTLQDDARIPYLEIARKLIVSGGTIHQRIDKLKKLGVIKGSKIVMDHKALGLDVTAFLGVHLNSAKSQDKVISLMGKLPEIVEVYYTTGNYALLVKVITNNISDFHEFLSQKLQKIDAIQSTESFIVLNQPIQRDITL